MNHYSNLLLRNIIWLFFFGNASASHMMGADLSYKRLGSDSFEIIVKVYRDCNGIIVSNTPIYIMPLNCTGSSTGISLQQISITDITSVCAGLQSKCAGGIFPYGIEEYLFKGIINLASYTSCCKFNISWEQQARNSSIGTGQDGQNFYTAAILDKCVRNSSPQIINKPIAIVCTGQDFCFNNGVADTIDGDSLSFSLTDPLVGYNSPATYSGTYNAQRPMHFLGYPNYNTTLPAGFHLNGATGDLCFRPTMIQIGVFVIKITEWRRLNGTVTNIGETRRDMQLISMSGSGCTSNKTPVLPNIATKNVCANNKVTFNITPTDLNTGDSLKVFWNKSIPGATFTTTNGTAKIGVGTFSWTPTNKDTSSNLYYFTVSAYDNACPLPGVTSKAYSIRVFSAPDMKIFAPNTCYPDTNIFIDSSFIAYGVPAYRKWSFDDGDTSDQKSLTHAFDDYGSYNVKLKLVSDNGCKDSMVKTVKYSPKPNAAFDISINCRELQDTFQNTSSINPDTIQSNLWDFGDSSFSNSLSPIKTYAKPGIYNVKLITISDNGCSDTAERSVGENLYLDKLRDTILCKGQSVSYNAAGSGGDPGRYAFSWDHGLGISTSIQVKPDTTTTYRVILTDSCNNVPDTGYVTVNVREPLQVEPRSDTIICIGQSVKLAAQLSGGYSPGYYLSWDQGQGSGNNFFVSPSSTTTYQVILSDNCSTPDTGSITVNVRSSLSIEPRTDTTICVGQDVLLSAIAYGGDTLNHRLSWNHGLGEGYNFTITPSATTIYRVVLSDNCTQKSDTGYVAITVRAPLDVNERLDTFFCNGQGAMLYANAKGGDSMSYTYTWDHGLGTGNYILQTPSITTTYMVIVSDNCTSENDTGNFTLFVRVPLNLIVPNDTLICKGQPISLHVAGTGGDSLYYTYEWDHGLGWGNNKQVAPDAAVSYQVIFTDNCTLKADTGYLNITTMPPLKVIPRSDTTICIGQSVLLNASSAGGNFAGHSFDWDQGPGTGKSFFVSPEATTVYRVVLSDNCTAKPDTGFVQINVRPALKVSPMSDTTICIGQSLAIHANSSGGYSADHILSWDQGLGSGNNLNISPPVTTTYQVILTDNCTSLQDTGFVNVTLRSPLKVIPRSDTLICIGQSVNLSALANGGHAPDHVLSWDQGLGNGSSFTVSPAVSTTYKVILNDKCTTVPDSGNVTVSVRPALKVSGSTDTTICIGQILQLFASGSGGDSGNFSYTWQSSVSGFAWNNIRTGIQTIVSPEQTTFYRMILADNCTKANDTLIIKVTVNPPLEIDAGPDQLICFGQTADLNATGSGGHSSGYLFNWDKGMGSGASQQISPKINTTYMVILSDGCTSKSDTDYVTVQVRPELKVIAGPLVNICFGQSATIYSAGSGGDVSNYNFSWDNGIGQGNAVTVSPAITTTYTVTLDDGCSINAKDTVTVVVEQLPVPDFYAVTESVCFPEIVEFKNISKFPSPCRFSWNFGDMSTSSEPDPQHFYPAPGMYNVMLKVTTASGCSDSLNNPGYITIHPKPIAAFIADPESTTILKPLIRFTNLSVGADEFQWNFADNSPVSADQHIEHLYEDTASYQVTLISKNQFDCSDTASLKVRIKDVFHFYIPNAFTPNGDVLNDEFAPAGKGIVNYKTQVFNRWGEMVFESSDKSINWNGGFFNKTPVMQSGVYTYQFTVLDFEGRQHFFNGVVHLLK